MITSGFPSARLPRAPKPLAEFGQTSPAQAVGTAAPPASSSPPARWWQPRWTLGLTQPGQVLLIFLFSAALALGTFALDGNVGINLADEGFLWYGSSAILQGQVPLRDFQSYDPGRYYWVAGWSLVFGDGLVAMRLACAIFQVFGVCCGLLALREAGQSWRVIVLAGSLATCWMLEHYKVYEQCLALMALYPAVRLIRRPDWRNGLLGGCCVGLAAFFGRNHGMYQGVAFAGIFLLLAWKERRAEPLLRPAGAWVGGVILGYSPMLLMLTFVPGYATAIWESLRLLARNGATNYTIPVPWPWTLDLNSAVSTSEFYSDLAQGWCYALLLGGFALAAVVVARLPAGRLRAHSALAAGCVVGIPYAHYAFSRADAPHLAHSMPALILTLLALPAALATAPTRRAASILAALGLGVLTVLGTLLYNPVWNFATLPAGALIDYDLNGETLRLGRDTADFLDQLRRFERKNVRPRDGFLVTPYGPAFYNVLQRPSPLWEIYFLWSPTAERQSEMIRQLEEKNVRWVLLQLTRLDGRDDRQLRATHPLFFKYLMQHYVPVKNVPLPRRFFLLERADSEPPR